MDRPIKWHNYFDTLYTYISEHGGATQQILETIDAAVFRTIIECMRLYFFHPENHDSYWQKAKKIREMKQMPRYKASIQVRQNQYIPRKSRVLKAALRQPFIWPIEMLYVLNERALRR